MSSDGGGGGGGSGGVAVRIVARASRGSVAMTGAKRWSEEGVFKVTAPDCTWVTSRVT